MRTTQVTKFGSNWAIGLRELDKMLKTNGHRLRQQ